MATWQTNFMTLYLIILEENIYLPVVTVVVLGRPERELKNDHVRNMYEEFYRNNTAATLASN